MGAQSWSRRLKIVAETSDHPSRCRWTAGKRASSKDARDILVSKPNQSAYQSVGRRVVCMKSNAASWESADGELQIGLNGRSVPDQGDERVCVLCVVSTNE